MFKNFLDKSFTIKNIFPFLNWIGELKNKKTLKADIIAGISVALVLIPQSMAYAELAGLPAKMGLYAAFIPTIIAGLFGSSRQSSTGPVAVVSLLTAASLGSILPHNSEGYIVYATLMAFIVGLFQLILGITHMGVIIKFLSHPVIRGFTNAAAIIIIVSQIPKILGITINEGDYLFETTINIIKNIGSFDITTLLIGLFSFVSIIYFKTYRDKFPGILIVIIITTIVSWQIGFSGIIGEVPRGLGKISLPKFNLTIILEIITSAIIIGLIGFMEAISIAKTLAIKTEHNINVNRELIGQGLANLGSGILGGYPVAGSFSRSAIANNTNAKTGFTAVISGLIVGITLLFLTPILYYIPKVTLAVIIIIAVFNLINFSSLIRSLKIEPHDFAVGIVTFLSTLFFAPNLEKGLFIGVLLSVFLFLYRTMTPRFIEVSMYKDGSLRDVNKFSLQTSKNIGVYRFDGTLYFANSEYFNYKLIDFLKNKQEIKLIILDFEGVDDIDLTGLNTLERIIKKIKTNNIEIYIIRAKLQIKKVLEKSGFIDDFGEDKFFYNIKDALKYANKYIKGLDKLPLKKYKPIIATTKT